MNFDHGGGMRPVSHSIRVYILNRRGGSNLQDEYSIIGSLYGIAYLKSLKKLDAPILLAQL